MGIQTTLGLLPQAPPALAREMYEAALAEPEGDVQRAAVRAALSTARPELIHQVLAAVPRLAAPARAQALEGQWTLAPHLRTALAHPDRTVRIGALRLLTEAVEPEIGALAAAALGDREPEIRALALDVLQALVSTHLPPSSATAPRPGGPTVVSAVTQALSYYADHRRPFFLEALVRLGEESHGTLTHLLLGPVSAARSDLILVLERMEDPAAAALLLRLLRERDEELRQTARTIVRKKRTPGFARAVCALLAGLNEAAFAAQAGRTAEIPWWAAVGDHLGDGETGPLLRVVDFVAAARIDAPSRLQALQECLRAPQPPVRRAALRKLRGLGADAVRPALDAGLADPDGDVQLEAIEALDLLDPPDKVKRLTALVTSPHAAVRQAAMTRLSRDSFERYLRSFDRLDERTRALAGQAIAKLDPALAGRLSEEIRALEPDRRLKAIRIIEYVNKEQELEPLLRELISDPDRKVRATVVHAVGLAGSVEAIKALLRALADPDRRVRANTIEAFEEIGNPRLADLLVPFTKDPDNRVRANAVKALWHLGRAEARPMLEEMLADPDERMRLSAVWTLGETAMPGAAELLRAARARETSATVFGKIDDVLKELDRPRAE